MRSKAAFSGVSRSEYLLVSIVLCISYTSNLFSIGPQPKYFVAWLAIPAGYTPQMELRHLRYFVAVAEEQNITRAASRLHVSQPPLSRQIRNLEDELGIALFEHKAKAIRLTDAGQVFLIEARSVLQRAEE